MSVISSATTFLKVAFVLFRFLLRQLLSFLAILTGVSKSGKKKNNLFLTQEQGYNPVGDELNPVCNVNSEKLPADLPNGIYIRNGPNPQHPPRGDYHLFEGDGMLHAAIITDGNVRYTNRYVKTEKYEMEKEFEEPILWGFFYRVNPFVQLHYWYLQHLRGLAGIPSGNAGNTSLVYHANTCLALYEGGLPYEIELPSLETINNEKRNIENGYFAKNAGIYLDSRRCFTFKGQWKFTSFTAHPKVDPDTHEMVSFGYLGTQMPYLHYGVIDKKGDIVHQVTFDNEQDDMILLMKAPSMLHDMAITKNYTIMMLFPLHFDKKLVIEKRLPFHLDKSTKSVFAIIPRYYKKGQDKIKVFQADPCYVFHVFGAYETQDGGNKVVLRGCKINDIDIELKSVAVEESITEWTFDLDTLATTETAIKFDTNEGAKSINCDFPQIHPSLTGKPFRYGYAVFTDVASGGCPQLHKLDFDNKTAVTMSFAKHHLIGEYSVVPKTNGKQEDDVYLLTFSTDVKNHKSYLEVVDGKTMIQVTRVELPRQIARGFHGIWVNESDYKKNVTSPASAASTTVETIKEEEVAEAALQQTVATATDAEAKLEEQLAEESLATVIQNALEE